MAIKKLRSKKIFYNRRTCHVVVLTKTDFADYADLKETQIRECKKNSKLIQDTGFMMQDNAEIVSLF